MADDRIYTTGIPGQPYNRLEIRDFVLNEKFFSLYIQALQAIQNVNQADLKSFFQLGGIHGLPYIPWGDSLGDTFTWGGYCTHGNVLFPTWHRPYMSLYEQILQDQAVKIAATYQVDQDAWKDAANQLRQPYWDWAKNSVPPAEVLELKLVTITGPDGDKTVVDNPLYNYNFNPIDSSFPGPYSRWRTTLRRPTSRESTATDNVLLVEQVLRNSQGNITDNTYAMLTLIHDWESFSNHTTTNGQSKANSLESIHDGIHVLVGGAGQMGDPAVAGFDPIFYLHHANVDRLLSLWYALNYTVWVSTGDSIDGTITIPPGVNVDNDSSLTPFWKADANYWSSATLKDTAALGYTYPEFNGLQGQPPQVVQEVIRQKVDELYGGSVVIGLPGARQEKEGEARYYDWTARIEFKKNELLTSFTVLFFVGEVPDDPQSWLVSSNLVGSYHAFVNSVARRCANCRDQSDLVVEGFVHLNRGIERLSKLPNFESGRVAQYLQDPSNLKWRVQRADGEPALLHSLKVTVYQTDLKRVLDKDTVILLPGKREIVFKA